MVDGSVKKPRTFSKETGVKPKVNTDLFMDLEKITKTYT